MSNKTLSARFFYHVRGHNSDHLLQICDPLFVLCLFLNELIIESIQMFQLSLQTESNARNKNFLLILIVDPVLF